MKKAIAWSIALYSAFGVTTGSELARASIEVVTVNPLRDAYFGDLHVHTKYSFDAYLYWHAQVDPDEAYRFARGEPGRYLDEEVRRSTPPLDFMAVTDHAEWLGVVNTLEDPDSALSRSSMGKLLQERGTTEGRKLGWPSSAAPLSGVDSQELARSAWEREIDAANRNYEPGKFTTFIAYEWTGMRGDGGLHRNVIFSGDRAPNPFTAFDSNRPEDLWTFLENSRKEGYEALAIPHNSNLSDGWMFDWLDSAGKPIDQGYAERRAVNEPLVEITQNKGQSETHPVLSPNDEFANFEVWDQFGKFKPQGSYVRDALGRGLVLATRVGVDAFKYGFVGGSDFHNGLSDSAEAAFAGGFTASEPTQKPLSIAEVLTRGGRPQEDYKSFQLMGSAGLTGVWAESNTRESIFAALRRKETFATSGTRLKLRFFGGWGFSPAMLRKKDWIKLAYGMGVSMGGDLSPRPAGIKAPTFALWAARDPNGADLDRLQVVKVWIKDGQQLEKIYDVALSNGRNTAGAAELSAVWQDPQFDPRAPSVYYLRVLEIPTPRWSTLVAARLGQAVPQGIPATIQERGWSSPIWYLPLKLNRCCAR